MLTQKQKELIRTLVQRGLDEDEVLGVILTMNTEKKQEELAKILEQNPEATPQEVLRMELNIMKKYREV